MVLFRHHRLIAKSSYFAETRTTAEFAERAAAAFNGEPVDFLFIDGDHLYDGVKIDFELYKKLVRPGGLIAFSRHRRESATPRKSGLPILERRSQHRRND